MGATVTFSLDEIQFILKPKQIAIAASVQLTSSLNAIAQGNVVELKWKNEPQPTFNTFEIERLSSSVWEKIGEVTALDTTNGYQTYTYIDNLQNTNGENARYRLKTLSNDGNLQYSNEVEVIALPVKYTLENNFPNPFNPQTKIQYSIPENAVVQLIIYDALGRQIAELVNEKQEAGFYSKTFEGQNLSSGVYFYRLIAQTQGKNIFTQIKKMVLIK